ncbi:unnamed protein product [Rangifer tarandus platyrhynchus]|uniref:Uncharacterized protein n=2 Tax=Rangifer tarandus platyrhynchus TaxID=3082113 RepID=A0ACB0E9S4_RANTA|nr:unnamed protein product [Rangifer tarandus platyrhynchus]CAI9697204.1 unnamed protein product [Rangifer tarandus platyrhynchus]
MKATGHEVALLHSQPIGKEKEQALLEKLKMDNQKTQDLEKKIRKRSSLPTLQGRPPIPIYSLRPAGHPPFVSNTSPSSRPERSGDSGRLGGRPSASRLRARRIPAGGPPAKARRLLSGFPRSLCSRGTLACPAPPTPAHPAEPHRPRAPFHPRRARLHEPTSSPDPLSSRQARDSLPPQDCSSPLPGEEPSCPSCPGTHRRSAGKHQPL